MPTQVWEALLYCSCLNLDYTFELPGKLWKNTDSWVLPLGFWYDWLGFGLDFEHFKSFQVRVSTARAEHFVLYWKPSEVGTDGPCQLQSEQNQMGQRRIQGKKKEKKWGGTRKFRERETVAVMAIMLVPSEMTTAWNSELFHVYWSVFLPTCFHFSRKYLSISCREDGVLGTLGNADI